MTVVVDVPAKAPTQGRSYARSRAPIILIVGVVLLVSVSLVNLLQGPALVTASEVLSSLFSRGHSQVDVIVRDIRLPRVCAGILVGASLAVSGALFQAVTRNPLGSPDILGVNAGAFLATVAAAVFLPTLPGLPTIAIAIFGGLVTAALVYFVAASVRPTPLRLSLSGVAVALMLSAAAGGLQLLYEVETSGLFFWGQGTIVQDSWTDIRLAGPMIVLALLGGWMLARPLDVLGLGDTTAEALGQRVGLLRAVSWILAVFLASVAVSLAGPVGFVGLMAPHIVRLLGITRHNVLIPASMLCGAIVVVGADDLARPLGSNVQEVPAGVVTALLGLPFLVWLARRTVGGALDDPKGSRSVRTASASAYGTWLGVAVVVLVGAAVLSLFTTSMQMSSLNHFVLFELRMPRIALAMLGGAALGVSGYILQVVLRNPLAEPALVGIMPGATIGALLALLVYPDTPLVLLPLVAFFGGVGTFALAYLSSWRNGGVESSRLALVGVGFAAAGTGLVSLIVVQSQVQLSQALVWLVGSTYGSTWGDVTRLTPWVLILVPAAWIAGRQLDLFPLGDSTIRALGTRLELTRLALLAIAVALASAAVSVLGALGFVGMVAPHLARLLAPGRSRRMVALVAVLGAGLVVAADLVGRLVLAPKEVPAGVVTALVGTPFFIWLLWRSRR